MSVWKLISGISTLTEIRQCRLCHVMRKPVLPYANTKGADQPVHPYSLNSAFGFHCLDSIMSLVSKVEASS